MVGKLDIQVPVNIDSFGLGTDNCCAHPDERKPQDKIQKVKECLVIFTAEFLGTAILLFSGCLCGVQFSDTPNPLAGPVGFGFVVCMVISIFGPHSGAHVNPAVTLCAILYGSLPYQMFLVYVPAQILGGLFGFGLLSVSIPWSYYSEKSAAGICMTLPLEGMETGTAFICEFCFTAILILVCCGLWDRRSGHLQDSGAIKFGLTIAALSIAGGQLTGASMNPARSLAPAVWQGNMSFQWLYWVTPMVSSLVTTLFYRFVLSENKKTD